MKPLTRLWLPRTVGLRASRPPRVVDAQLQRVLSHWTGRSHEFPTRCSRARACCHALGCGAAVSRTKKQRLRLFGLGNDRCPICLRPFTQQAVEEGKTVTLEHVPPRSFKAGGIAMCLTCKPCNHGAGRAEQVAVEAVDDEVKVRLDVAGLPPFTARVAVRANDTFFSEYRAAVTSPQPRSTRRCARAELSP